MMRSEPASASPCIVGVTWLYTVSINIGIERPSRALTTHALIDVG